MQFSSLTIQVLVWAVGGFCDAGGECAATTCKVVDTRALLQTSFRKVADNEEEGSDDPTLADSLHANPFYAPEANSQGLNLGSREACLAAQSMVSHNSLPPFPATAFFAVDPTMCNEEREVLMLSLIARSWKSLPGAAEVHKKFGIPPYTCVLVFAACSFIFIFTIIRSVVTMYKSTKEINCRYPEADAWRKSKIDWLWMGWATQWISRWGTAENSALTKISSSDIPLSDPDDECELCFRRFDKIWKEELARVGELNASLLKVVTRFVTYKKIFAIAFWNAFYEGFMFLGPPLAIKWVTKYLNWLYTQRGLGTVIGGHDLIGPSLLMMLIFCGLPVLMAISNSMCTMLNGRISIRIDGALSLAVYDKAQRLPVVQDDADDLAITKTAGKRKKQSPNSKRTPEDEEFDEEPPDDTEKLWANNGVNKRFNLVQVVTNDINTNLMTIPNSLARMVVMVPVLIGTLCMLIGEIGVAFLFSLAMAIANLALMTTVGLLMRTSLGDFYSTSGKRLQFLQEVLVGIRFIKGCGAEGIVQERLAQARAKELRALDTFYTIQCFMFILTMQLPKLYILASLGGYALLHHGQVEPTVIMSLIPLLMSVQGAIAVVFSLIPTLVLALPSCRRLETFLKIREAPRAVPAPLEGVARESPTYVTVTKSEEEPILRLQGDFCWQSWIEPTLFDIDLCLPRGKLVAVLGSVGSGKTTLLHSILGELFPRGDSRLEVQRRIAYSAQTPHLFEGSLKENILKGDPMDKARYKEAIYSACLLPDLDMLPGGDEVPVGGRGITLSGGQKARVSLARAAYDSADLVLIDDPFAAVDAHTGRHLNEHLLHGPLLRGRTRIVVCQPDTERIARFDWAIIMAEGRVVAQGPAPEVMQTEEYKGLLCSISAGASCEEEPAERSQQTKKAEVLEVFELREEECEGRASWATMSYFCRIGGWLGISTCVLFYLVKNVLDMRTQVQLSMWMSHGSMFDAGLTTIKPSPWMYILNYIFWMAGSTVAWFVCWVGGQSWTLNISDGCHRAMCRALLRAPVDRFYDKTPTGRIMNRMANDMMNVDMQVFVGCCSTIGMIWSMSVPIYYVHIMMPLWFTLLTIPMYYLIILLISLYWKTMVPLRYLMQVSKSGVSSEIADVETTPATVRAYGMEDYRLKNFALAVRKMISADFLGRIICIRWLCNRLFVLGGCFVTGLALLCVWLPGALDVGSASLVINTMFAIIVMIEGNLSTGSMAQYQIIAMNRIYEYTALPEEREEVLAKDSAFQNHSISVGRTSLGFLEIQQISGHKVEVVRVEGAYRECVLSEISVSGRSCLVAADDKMLSDLAPGCQALRGVHKWHRIISVNGETGPALKMANELCLGDSENVSLLVESGWLADGVKIEIKDLTVGYADVPVDVLHGISLIIPRFCKAGVVGPTGCGKSTLLLSILRMLEPRGGSILLEGVDTQTLGLRTLRNAMGLVPQDPVLLQGTLRFNIDPFEMYTDERITEALELVHMSEYVNTLAGGLDYAISGEGANLSFGQRQLLSLARNIVRHPMLLLLDEATSAIDPHTQELLQCTIQKAFKEATMVVIAHRLETILDFDLAIVMDRGRIVEKGTLRSLADSGGRLTKMLAAKGISLPPEGKAAVQTQHGPLSEPQLGPLSEPLLKLEVPPTIAVKQQPPAAHLEQHDLDAPKANHGKLEASLEEPARAEEAEQQREASLREPVSAEVAEQPQEALLKEPVKTEEAEQPREASLEEPVRAREVATEEPVNEEAAPVRPRESELSNEAA